MANFCGFSKDNAEGLFKLVYKKMNEEGLSAVELVTLVYEMVKPKGISQAVTFASKVPLMMNTAMIHDEALNDVYADQNIPQLRKKIGRDFNAVLELVTPKSTSAFTDPTSDLNKAFGELNKSLEGYVPPPLTGVPVVNTEQTISQISAFIDAVKLTYGTDAPAMQRKNKIGYGSANKALELLVALNIAQKTDSGKYVISKAAQNLSTAVLADHYAKNIALPGVTKSALSEAKTVSAQKANTVETLEEERKKELKPLLEEKQAIENEIEELESGDSKRYKSVSDLTIDQKVDEEVRKKLNELTEEAGDIFSKEELEQMAADHGKSVRKRLVEENVLKDKDEEGVSKLTKDGFTADKEYSVKELGTKLQFKTNQPNTQILLVLNKVDLYTGENAVYDLASNNVYINPGKYKSLSYVSELILHELIHSVTAYVTIAVEKGNFNLITEKQIKAVNNLTKALARLREKHGTNSYRNEGFNPDLYGLENIDELMAELANPKFVETLQKSKNPDAINLWEAIKSFIKDIFEIKDSEFNVVFNSFLEILADFNPEAQVNISKTQKAFKYSKNKLAVLKERLKELNKKIAEINAKYDERIAALSEASAQTEDLTANTKLSEAEAILAKEAGKLDPAEAKAAQEARDEALGEVTDEVAELEAGRKKALEDAYPESATYLKNYKEIQTYGKTIRAAFNKIFDLSIKDPSNARLSYLLDFINKTAVPEDIKVASKQEALVQSYIDGEMSTIEKRNKSRSPKSKAGKINLRYDALLSKIPAKTTGTAKKGTATSTEDVKNQTVTAAPNKIFALTTVVGISYTKTLNLNDITTVYNTEGTRSTADTSFIDSFVEVPIPRSLNIAAAREMGLSENEIKESRKTIDNLATFVKEQNLSPAQTAIYKTLINRDLIQIIC